jgi:hypothetical protein
MSTLDQILLTATAASLAILPAVYALAIASVGRARYQRREMELAFRGFGCAPAAGAPDGWVVT